MDPMTTRLLKERDASREAGDILVRAALQTVKASGDHTLAAAVYSYMKREAVVDSTFFATMNAKERLILRLFRLLRDPDRS